MAELMTVLKGIGVGGVILIIVLVLGFLAMVVRFYRKIEQGKAMIRNGFWGTKVAFEGMWVIPIFHRLETMDISVKSLTIDRRGSEGLICKDNMRADIKVVFFVRVNKTEEDVLKVAQAIGCERASHIEALRDLFESKFSEGLKTVGKHFDFVELYNAREQFKEQILKAIGTDLNGFVLDDAAIDFLEQTQVEMLDPDNILDSEGIKKITELTSKQKILSNQINREREKVITQQDVEGKEAVLELNRQLAEATSKQKREVDSVQAREEAETLKIQQEELLRSERARITTEEEVRIAEQNRDRQVLVAERNKDRTDAIETERVEKDRMIEATERERIVELARIEKDKALEVEKKNIQNVIRDRVMVEKTVIEEQERIKDTQAFADAERRKKVALTLATQDAEETLLKDTKKAEADKKVAEMKAEEEMVRIVKAAEASKQAAELSAEESVVKAEAFQRSAEKEAAAKKLLAEATAAEQAAGGMAEVQVGRAKNGLLEERGNTEARVLEAKLQAEARGLSEKGEAEARIQELSFAAEAKGIETKGTAEARSLELQLLSEAKGIESKANAMKLLDGVGREHEEYKLRLETDKSIELARIETQRDVARSQAEILGSFLRYANIDIVGGEATFFEKMMGAVTVGKSVDRYFDNSKTLSDVKETFFTGKPDEFKSRLKGFFDQFGISLEDVRNLTFSAALAQLASRAETSEDRGALYHLMGMAERLGISDKLVDLKKSES